MSASRGKFHVACFLFVFHCGLFPVPQVRHEFEGTPLFFLRESGCVKQRVEREMSKLIKRFVKIVRTYLLIRRYTRKYAAQSLDEILLDIDIWEKDRIVLSEGEKMWLEKLCRWIGM